MEKSLNEQLATTFIKWQWWFLRRENYLISRVTRLRYSKCPVLNKLIKAYKGTKKYDPFTEKKETDGNIPEETQTWDLINKDFNSLKSTLKELKEGNDKELKEIRKMYERLGNMSKEKLWKDNGEVQQLK